MPLLVISTIVPVLNSGEMNGKHVTPTQLTSLFDARLKLADRRRSESEAVKTQYEELLVAMPLFYEKIGLDNVQTQRDLLDQLQSAKKQLSEVRISITALCGAAFGASAVIGACVPLIFLNPILMNVATGVCDYRSGPIHNSHTTLDCGNCFLDLMLPRDSESEGENHLS
ncbi:hypothetical protein SISNIDRAFT_68320 [Sistotremastrum niveocremeum HHB9708]|uniref:Uncharacterized protein n=1 Tax=Sistotremastrum niveocremeum HHB9708 TaxID=1314777 RepID=A0A164V321_9AGAM|nr:hypothetical protein SISNIDRAFT_68320 [Sistotremastrum niveocremeum HHB9708]